MLHFGQNVRSGQTILSFKLTGQSVLRSVMAALHPIHGFFGLLVLRAGCTLTVVESEREPSRFWAVHV